MPLQPIRLAGQAIRVPTREDEVVEEPAVPGFAARLGALLPLPGPGH